MGNSTTAPRGARTRTTTRNGSPTVTLSGCTTTPRDRTPMPAVEAGGRIAESLGAAAGCCARAGVRDAEERMVAATNRLARCRSVRRHMAPVVVTLVVMTATSGVRGF